MAAGRHPSDPVFVETKTTERVSGWEMDPSERPRSVKRQRNGWLPRAFSCVGGLRFPGPLAG
ncbi:hypothetical protein B1694_09040 [Geobacillus zalihae]|nr:hypothetical protein B1694_09040 [Geobacillus zalihae]